MWPRDRERAAGRDRRHPAAGSASLAGRAQRQGRGASPTPRSGAGGCGHRTPARIAVTTASPVAQVIAFWPWDAEGAAASLQRLRESISPGTDVLVLDREPGFAAALNQLASSAPRADLAIVADACALPAGWLERIRRAASGDDALAGATAPASEAGTPIVVPDPVHPRISRLRPQCAYVRRSALELLGPFEESLDHPAAVLDEFAARAISRGLGCVLADDVSGVRLAGGLSPCPESEREKVLRL